MHTREATLNCFFNVSTQTYSLERPPEQDAKFSVYIRLTTEELLPQDALLQIIRQLGNYMAIWSTEIKSRNTEENYCTDYHKHASTCEQRRWQWCKRHLNEQEMEECRQLKKALDPDQLLNRGISFKTDGPSIERGDIDTMRSILQSVRNAPRP